MTSISACNKDDDQFRKYIEQWGVFWRHFSCTKKGIEQHRKQKCLKSVISQGKAYLLGAKHKWTHEQVDKASDKTIDKTYAEFKQRELSEKGEKYQKNLMQASHQFVFYLKFLIWLKSET